MKASTYPDLQSVSWRPRKVNAVFAAQAGVQRQKMDFPYGRLAEKVNPLLLSLFFSIQGFSELKEAYPHWRTIALLTDSNVNLI